MQTNTKWMADAICHGHTNLFFAPAGERPAPKMRREAAARAMCGECPVQVPCGQAGALGELNDGEAEQGMWGGLIPVAS